MKYILKSCRIVFSVIGVIILIVGLILGFGYLLVDKPIITLCITIILFILILAYCLREEDERR